MFVSLGLSLLYNLHMQLYRDHISLEISEKYMNIHVYGIVLSRGQHSMCFVVHIVLKYMMKL